MTKEILGVLSLQQFAARALVGLAVGATSFFPAWSQSPDEAQWLEDESVEMSAWVASQNARTRSFLDSLPNRAAIASAFERSRGQQIEDNLTLKAAGQWYFKIEGKPGGNGVVISRWQPGQAVQKATVTKADGNDHVCAYYPSPDGSLIAIAFGNPANDCDLFIYRFSDPEAPAYHESDFYFPTGLGSFDWDEDSRSFFYTKYTGKPGMGVKILHGSLDGTGGPKVVFGEGYPDNITLDVKRSESHLLIVSIEGDGGEIKYHIRGPDGYWRRILREYTAPGVAICGKSLYFIKRTPGFNDEVMKFDLDSASPPIQQKIHTGRFPYIGPQPMVCGPKNLILASQRGGENAFEVHWFDTGRTEEIEAREGWALASVQPGVGDELIVTNSTYRRSSYVSIRNRAGVDTSPRVAPNVDRGIQVSRKYTISTDGTVVPYVVLSRAEIGKERGTVPTLLTGYGYAGVSEHGDYIGDLGLTWINMGGQFVTTVLRGGNDFGESWRRSGRGRQKQNTFADFLSVARALVREGSTEPAKLGIIGSSAGGLLVNVAITQAPHLFGAAVSQVSIADVIRNERTENGRWTATELGSADDPDMRPVLESYSPFQNVVKSVCYPPLLLVSNKIDYNVNSLNSRKFQFRLLERSSSDQHFLMEYNVVGHTPPLARIVDNLTFFSSKLQLWPGESGDLPVEPGSGAGAHCHRGR